MRGESSGDSVTLRTLLVAGIAVITLLFADHFHEVNSGVL